MTEWPSRPIIYEVNTAVWLTSLGQRYRHTMTLETIPDEVFDELARMNIDAVWLMGVWQRSEAGYKSALNYLHEYRRALPDITAHDVIGSAYAVGAYVVDVRFGGRKGLAAFRDRLQARHIRLILDYVPNHVALDHAWVTHGAQYMLCGTEQDFDDAPGMFFPGRGRDGGKLFVAHGRDPHFPPWVDTAQVNAFAPGFRQEAARTLLDIADQCDGVRCDMAMLMVNDVFAKTWASYLNGKLLRQEFWEEIIPIIRAKSPDFKFIAEVYWNMEYTLLKQGFDMTYDKRLYDFIHEGRYGDIRRHLQTKMPYQERQVRFIENHDEHRAAASLGIEKSRAAATLIFTIPGSVLLHDGQCTGRKVKLPVQINRQPDEPSNRALAGFYHKLLSEIQAVVYQSGRWQLFDVTALYPDDVTFENLIAYGWAHTDGYRVIVVNLSERWSQGVVKMESWRQIRRRSWRLFDVLSGMYTYRDGDKMVDDGLAIELEAYQSVIFRLETVQTETDLR